MKDTDKEKISRLMDNHWERFEEDSLIKELKSDSDLLHVWRRYHLIGETIRGNCSIYKSSICSNVMQQLEQEPTILAPRWRVPKVDKWLKEVGIGTAVAAAILIAIILLPIGQPQDESTSPMVSGIIPNSSERELVKSPVYSSPKTVQTPIQTTPIQSAQISPEYAQAGGGGIPELEKLLRAHTSSSPRGFAGHLRSARTASLVLNKTSTNP